jgi:hypothetical protein
MFLALAVYKVFVNLDWKMNLRFFLADKTLKMLFVGARRVLNAAESGAATRLNLASSVMKHEEHSGSPDVKHNYRQMFLNSQCQLQSQGTVKVPTSSYRTL